MNLCGQVFFKIVGPTFEIPHRLATMAQGTTMAMLNLLAVPLSEKQYMSWNAMDNNVP